MNCRDFREIADSYLSDELAVETNHEIFQHLENCASCRQELAMRREVRDKLRISLKSSKEFAIDPIFVNKLRANLKAEAFQKKSWFNWKFLTPVLTGIMIVAGLGFFLSHFTNSTESANKTQSELSQQYIKAIAKHENCGLKNLHRWEASHKDFGEKAIFVKNLENNGTEVLEAHICNIDSTPYEHFIMRREGKVFSVLKTEFKDNLAPSPPEDISITCKKRKGMKIASFRIGHTLVFVVSDMSESENLNIARQLSDSIET